ICSCCPFGCPNGCFRELFKMAIRRSDGNYCINLMFYIKDISTSLSLEPPRFFNRQTIVVFALYHYLCTIKIYFFLNKVLIEDRMKTMFKYLMILPLAFVLVSCNQGANNETVTQVTSEVVEMPQPVSTLGFRTGDQVPNDMVCMVNDEYMGKKQIPVVVGATTYYGCCDMCV